MDGVNIKARSLFAFTVLQSYHIVSLIQPEILPEIWYSLI